jgi:hypothetical protein
MLLPVNLRDRFLPRHRSNSDLDSLLLAILSNLTVTFDFESDGRAGVHFLALEREQTHEMARRDYMHPTKVF